jgi:hypothetical protein
VTLITRLFVGVVIAAGAAALVARLPDRLERPELTMVFLGVMLAASLFKLRLPLGLGQSTMSMAYVVDFTVLVTLGADVAMLIAAAGVLTQCTVNVRRPQPWYRTAFSMATIVLSVQAAGLVWSAMSAEINARLLTVLVQLAAASVVYYVVNSGLVAAAVSLSSGVSAIGFWRRNFVGGLPGYLTAAAVASSVVTFQSAYTLLGVALVPMLVGHLAYAAWFRQQQPASIPATV